MSLENPFETEEYLTSLFRSDKRFKQKQEEGLKTYLRESEKTFSITNFLHKFNYNFALFWARNAVSASIIVLLLSGFSMASAAEFALADEYKPSNLLGFNTVQNRELTNADIQNGVLKNAEEFEAEPLISGESTNLYIFDSCGAAFKVPKTYEIKQTQESVSVKNRIDNLQIQKKLPPENNSTEPASQDTETIKIQANYLIDCYYIDQQTDILSFIRSIAGFESVTIEQKNAQNANIFTNSTALAIQEYYLISKSSTQLKAFAYQDILYFVNLPEGSVFQLDILAPSDGEVIKKLY